MTATYIPTKILMNMSLGVAFVDHTLTQAKE